MSVAANGKATESPCGIRAVRIEHREVRVSIGPADTHEKSIVHLQKQVIYIWKAEIRYFVLQRCLRGEETDKN